MAETMQVCPACADEYPASQAMRVDHEAGSGELCSDECAAAFKKHCDKPAEERAKKPLRA